MRCSGYGSDLNPSMARTRGESGARRLPNTTKGRKIAGFFVPPWCSRKGLRRWSNGGKSIVNGCMRDSDHPASHGRSRGGCCPARHLSGWITQGPEGAAFEREFAARRRAARCARSTGTTALHLALLAVGVRPATKYYRQPFLYRHANAVRSAAEFRYLSISIPQLTISTPARSSPLSCEHAGDPVACTRSAIRAICRR